VTAVSRLVKARPERKAGIARLLSDILSVYMRAPDNVGAGSGFIQQQDGGVEKKGPGNRQEPALSAGEPFAGGPGQKVIRGMGVRAGGVFQDLPESG
jgi:hypothetical protein